MADAELRDLERVWHATGRWIDWLAWARAIARTGDRRPLELARILPRLGWIDRRVDRLRELETALSAAEIVADDADDSAARHNRLMAVEDAYEAVDTHLLQRACRLVRRLGERAPVIGADLGLPRMGRGNRDPVWIGLGRVLRAIEQTDRARRDSQREGKVTRLGLERRTAAAVDLAGIAESCRCGHQRGFHPLDQGCMGPDRAHGTADYSPRCSCDGFVPAACQSCGHAHRHRDMCAEVVAVESPPDMTSTTTRVCGCRTTFPGWDVQMALVQARTSELTAHTTGRLHERLLAIGAVRDEAARGWRIGDRVFGDGAQMTPAGQELTLSIERMFGDVAQAFAGRSVDPEFREAVHRALRARGVEPVSVEEVPEQCGQCGTLIVGHHACQGVPGEEV